MHCQSPHEAALGERLCLIAQPFVIALSVRFRVLYNRQSVFNADGVAQLTDRLGAAPKVSEFPVIF